MAKAKIKAELVEAARAFMAGDDFKTEVVITMPASVMYSFESAMEEVLVSTEGLSTFKDQWNACYRKYERQWAKNELSRAWAMARNSAADFVGRENAAGHDGQTIFDQRYRQAFVAAKEAGELVTLATKLDNEKPIAKGHKVAKPGSACKRGQVRKGPAPKGGGKKRGVKGSRHNKRSK